MEVQLAATAPQAGVQEDFTAASTPHSWTARTCLRKYVLPSTSHLYFSQLQRTLSVFLYFRRFLSFNGGQLVRIHAPFDAAECYYFSRVPFCLLACSRLDNIPADGVCNSF